MKNISWVPRVELEPGTILQARYEIDQYVGHGRGGTVYVAYDKRLCRKSAVKVASGTDAALLQALKREALLLANISHRALPHVNDHFQELNRLYVPAFVPTAQHTLV